MAQLGHLTAGPRIRSAIRLRIGSHLRNFYTKLQREPVPDRHIDLVLELRRKERDRRREARSSR